MWKTITIDTRDMGAMSMLLDGMVHIIPRAGHQHHRLHIACWCDPRVFWPENGETCVVAHRHKRPPSDLYQDD